MAIMVTLLWTFAPFVLLALVTPVTVIPTSHFDEFFPQWNDRIQEILRNSCQKQYREYKTGKLNLIEGTGQSRLITPVIECILKEFPDFRKSELGASAVVLGLLPMILGSLGSTVAETALVARRRPLLGLLLAAGSPAVTVVRGSEFVQTTGTLIDTAGRAINESEGSRLRDSHRSLQPILAVSEYVLVAAAVANVVELAYRLGVHGIVIFAPNTIFLLPLWIATAVIIHLWGCIVLRSKVKLTESRSGSQAAKASLIPRLKIAFQDEFRAAAYQDPRALNWKGSNVLWFQLSQGLLTVGTVGQIVFGTLVFSSLVFFSVVDSILIISRFTLSAIACRLIVLIELWGLSQQMQG